MKSFIIATLLFSGIFGGHRDRDFVNCRLPNGHIIRIHERLCPKYTPKPTKSPKPTKTPKPTTTPRVTPTPTPTATPTPTPTVSITSVSVHLCSEDSSCFGNITGVEVFGMNFASDSRAKLLNGITEFNGTYMGGNGSTRILTDFTGLPHCTTYDLKVFGSTGIATSSSSVTTYCP